MTVGVHRKRCRRVEVETIETTSPIAQLRKVGVTVTGKIPNQFLPRVRPGGDNWLVIWMGRTIYSHKDRSPATTLAKHFTAFLKRQQSISVLYQAAWIASFNEYVTQASIINNGFDPPLVIV